MLNAGYIEKNWELHVNQDNGLQAYCEQTLLRTYWDKEIFYQRQCYPWINERKGFGKETDIRDLFREIRMLIIYRNYEK